MSDGELTQEQKVGRARTRAARRLREAFPDQWHALLTEEYTAEGMAYNPPKTERQKAAEQLAETLERFPDLLPVSLADILAFQEAKASVALDQGEIGTRSFQGDEPPPPAAEGESELIDPDEDGSIDDYERNDYA